MANKESFLDNWLFSRRRPLGNPPRHPDRFGRTALHVCAKLTDTRSLVDCIDFGIASSDIMTVYKGVHVDSVGFSAWLPNDAVEDEPDFTRFSNLGWKDSLKNLERCGGNSGLESCRKNLGVVDVQDANPFAVLFLALEKRGTLDVLSSFLLDKLMSCGCSLSPRLNGMGETPWSRLFVCKRFDLMREFLIAGFLPAHVDWIWAFDNLEDDNLRKFVEIGGGKEVCCKVAIEAMSEKGVRFVAKTYPELLKMSRFSKMFKISGDVRSASTFSAWVESDGDLQTMDDKRIVAMLQHRGFENDIALGLSKGLFGNHFSFWRNENVMTALVSSDKASIIKVLSLTGQEMNYCDKRGRTPYSIAVKEGCWEVALLLLERLSGVDGFDRVLPHFGKNRNTSLHLAVSAKQKKFVEQFVKFFPDAAWRKNDLGETPFLVSLKSGDIDCAKLLSSVEPPFGWSSELESFGGLNALCRPDEVSILEKIIFGVSGNDRVIVKRYAASL